MIINEPGQESGSWRYWTMELYQSNRSHSNSHCNKRQQGVVAFSKLSNGDKQKLADMLSYTVGRAGGDTVAGALALLKRDLSEPTSDTSYRRVRNRVLRLIEAGDDALNGYVCRFVNQAYGGVVIW